MFYIAELYDISVFSLLSEKERNGTLVQHLYIAISSLTIYSITVARSAPLRRNWELYQRLWHGVEHEWPISVRLPFKFILEYSAFFAVEVPFKNLMIIRNKLKV